MLTNFIKGTSAKSEPSTSSVIQITEQVYKLRNSNLVGPTSFMRGLTVYTNTGSKAAVKVVSYGGGGYTTIKDWLNCLPKENPPIPEGVLLNVFDNEQVIGRKRGLRPKNKCTSSVITNKAFVSLVLPSEHGGRIQERKDLRPPVCSSVNELEHYIDVKNYPELKWRKIRQDQTKRGRKCSN